MVWPVVVLDLSTNSYKTFNLPSDVLRLYLGGRALNSYFLRTMSPSRKIVFTDEDNIIVISGGILTGTIAPSSSRLEISTRMTPWGFFGDGSIGGDVGANFRRTGIGTLIIKGKAKRPTYLCITDLNKIRIKNASKYWGLTTKETIVALRTPSVNPLSVLVIGPSGENRVPGSVIMEGSGRCVARSGIGAVCGSKNLKAIVISGSRDIIPECKSFVSSSKRYHDLIQQHPAYRTFKKLGTTSLVGIYNNTENFPTKNWQEGTFKNWKDISGEKFHKKYVVKKHGCHSCSIHCGSYYKTKSGSNSQGVNYDSLNDFGAKIGNSDLRSILDLTERCNELGIDITYASSVISTLMHIYQDGYLKNYGYSLEWGNVEVSDVIIRELVKKCGFFGLRFRGGFLSGLRRLEIKENVNFGKFARYAIHIKGVPLSSYDPRTLKGASLGAMTSTRGADHLRSLAPPEAYGKHYYSVDEPDVLSNELNLPSDITDIIFKYNLLDPEVYYGKEHLIKFYQENNAISDSVGTCRFSSSWRFGIGPERLAELISSFLGIIITEQEMLEVGERCYATEMKLLSDDGYLSASDKLPSRFYTECLPPSLKYIDIQKMDELRMAYYRLCGYDVITGRPTNKTLRRLKI